MKKLIFFLIFIVLIFLLVISYFLFFESYRITGNDIGSYKEGQRVITASKKVFRPIKRKDVVIAELAPSKIPQIVQISGMPGDLLPTSFQEKTVPENTYLVTLGNGQQRWVIEDKVTRIVWYSY